MRTQSAHMHTTHERNAPARGPAGETPLDSNFVDFFLKGNLSLEKARRPKPYEWLPDQGWQDLTRLVQIGASKLNASGACVWVCACTLAVTCMGMRVRVSVRAVHLQSQSGQRSASPGHDPSMPKYLLQHMCYCKLSSHAHPCTHQQQ